MIWVWIFAAVALTALLLKGKNIAPHNFLWALLPIDRFGITVAGVTLKPIYIFSVILVMFAVFSKSFRMKIPKSVFVITSFFSIIVTLAMLLRGSMDVMSDIVIYTMFFFTAALAASSLSLISGRKDLKEIQEVMISAAVAYGIVFLVLFVFDSVGIHLPSVRTDNAAEASILYAYKNMTNGVFTQSVRLRGFYVDPNAASVPFIIGFAALCGKWTKEGGGLKNVVFSLVIIANIVLTSSRTALVVLAMLAVMAIFRLFFAKVKTTRKLIFAGVSLFVVFIGFAVLVYSNTAFSYVYDNLISGYTGRSRLTDAYGRFTIWKDALSNLTERNWFAGIGVRQVAALSEKARDSHNTFIEVTCSSGIIAGVYYTLYFLYPMVFAIKRRLMDKKNSFYITTLLFGYIGLFVVITTISHIVSVYMMYMAFLLFIIPGVLAEEDELLASRGAVLSGASS